MDTTFFFPPVICALARCSWVESNGHAAFSFAGSCLRTPVSSGELGWPWYDHDKLIESNRFSIPTNLVSESEIPGVNVLVSVTNSLCLCYCI
jgi:hypothetical protein